MTDEIKKVENILDKANKFMTKHPKTTIALISFAIGFLSGLML